MTIKTIRQLMRQSVFVGKDGVVEHQNAFVEILAYYEIVKSLLVKTPKDMAVVRENMEKARILAKVNGFINLNEFGHFSSPQIANLISYIYVNLNHTLMHTMFM